ncbi:MULTISPECIES: TonB-dependent siderophore receptor [unclassified Pseudomonas]|uniref:TonB-dependent siderophore receptor n=1 Tax=unclassified Pseudomonas TaxID=196821 RepID=UPI00244A467E|nr:MULTISPECIES: TonB-dependent siderophore receptor [unclassified Pseudomonas]MDG9929141.1 TonB-dependent siderophore receptor [Pseudomonas sp. GD04042]MDH0484077.1 TonB-dependent siderophore receptor [Pseudomonas sp. GD04015]MDH0605885.1 TonB-dependent siderophore receptor [Pseudomonas sp. GD03869]
MSPQATRPSLARKPLAMAVLGATLALHGGLVQPLLADAGQARAEAPTKHYAIPAGPLGAVLGRFASEADVVLSFDAGLTAGKQSPGLQGSYGIEQGFARLLAGSGLQLARGTSGDYTLVPQADGEGAVVLGATSIDARGLGTTTEGSGSYATGAITLGKTTQTLRETPQSVSVMTRQLMDDKNLTSLDQVMAKAPGITFSQRNYGAHVFQSRGFVLGEESYLMDGVPGQAYTVTGWLPPDMAIYDRVEVLRGAAGLLVGAGDPGGAVNLVRKRPTAEPKFSVSTRAGSWDNYRLDLDGSGRLNDAGTLRGRAVAAYEDKGSYLDEKQSKTPLLYGIVEGDLDDDTTLTLSLRRQTGRIDGYSIFGLPRYSNGQALDISRSTALVQDWNRHETEMNEAFVELDHRFDDNWTGTTSFTYSDGGFEQDLAYARGAIDPVTQTGSTFRGVQFRELDVTSKSLDSHLNGTFEAFGLTHQITVGANWSQQNVKDKMADIFFAGAERIPVNVFDVDHHAFARPAKPAWTSITNLVDERYGLYANSRLRMSEPLSLILGARVSWFDYDFDYRMEGMDYVTKESGQVTPFAGLVYDIDQNWSWYASYADIFQPQSRYRDVSGAGLEPAVGANYETGIKGELFDKRLNLSAALFYVKQEDVLVEDAANSGQCMSNDEWGTCYTNGTIQRSKGVDLEASGEVLPGLQVLAGYTYNMTRSSNGGPVASETPRHLARVSTSYTLPGNWNRLTIGAGVSAQSRYENETWDGYKYGAAGRAIWDARVAWKLDQHWLVSVTGENLLDRKYYVAADGVDRVNLFGAPRSYVLTLRGDF